MAGIFLFALGHVMSRIVPGDLDHSKYYHISSKAQTGFESSYSVHMLHPGQVSNLACLQIA